MTLQEIITGIAAAPDEATIFAHRTNGEFRPLSAAVLVNFSDVDRQRPVREVAAEQCPGMEYFLEVELVRELLDAWRENHNGQVPPIDQALESVIFYAENDAYPDSFFG
ncbi:hypothetical protein E4K72_19775 [Oxalobacteraceae bacterium OM1]|nr:hypothetical protein E4K72_19775 [Oxalobacteraceae bacterium OM1]